MRARTIIAALIAALALPACRHDLGALAMIAPGDAAIASTGAAATARVEGRDCALSLMGLPLRAPDLGRATRAALAHRRGATRLTDARVASSDWTVFAVGRSCLIVSGTPD